MVNTECVLVSEERFQVRSMEPLSRRAFHRVLRSSQATLFHKEEICNTFITDRQNMFRFIWRKDCIGGNQEDVVEGEIRINTICKDNLSSVSGQTVSGLEPNM